MRKLLYSLNNEIIPAVSCYILKTKQLINKGHTFALTVNLIHVYLFIFVQINLVNFMLLRGLLSMVFSFVQTAGCGEEGGSCTGLSSADVLNTLLFRRLQLIP